MTFRLSKEARNYFKKIDERSKSGIFESVWDKYYLCLMAGFSRQKIVGDDEIPPAEDEFVDHFIKDYFDQRYQIIGALIAAEIERLGFSKDDKEKISNLMLELLDHTSINSLSSEGYLKLNEYAEGGFRVIREEIPQPYELDMFLKFYYEIFIESNIEN